MNKSNAARDSKVHEAVLSAEMQARDEYHLNMEKERLKSRLEKESLIMQVKYYQGIALIDFGELMF